MKEELIKEIEKIEAKHWWYVGRREIILSAIKKYALGINKEFRLLDIGCGTGENIKYFSCISKNIKGVEANKTALELAAAKQEFPVSFGNLPDNIPFKGEEFDIVFLLDVLEHVEEEDLSLKNIKSLIKPGGYLIITVPAFMFLWSNHDELNEHKRRYTNSGLREKVENSGYKIVFSSYFNSVLFPAVALVRLLKNKTGFFKEESDFLVPGDLINSFLLNLMCVEKHLIKTISIPFGSSVLLVARKI